MSRASDSPPRPAARLAAAIDRTRLAEGLRELVAIESVNPFDGSLDAGTGERAAAGWLGGQLEQLGWRTELLDYEPGRTTLLARHPAGRGGGPSLMMAGHLDTVDVANYPDGHRPRMVDGRVYGRGACDMKAALACYLEAARCLADLGIEPCGELLIAGVADEEYRQRGAKLLGAAGIVADGVVIGEPTELRLCSATKGLAAFDLTVTGRATHGGTPQHGDNAILELSRMLIQLDRDYGEAMSGLEHPLLGPPTLNLGRIEGGTAPNTVPDRCTAQFTRRLLPGESWESVRPAIAAALDAAGAGSWELSDPWWLVDPYELPPGERLERAAEAALAAVGLDPTPTGFPASSDAAYFGSPVALLGPGSIAQAHSTDEWVTVDDLLQATRIYLELAGEMVGYREAGTRSGLADRRDQGVAAARPSRADL
jgi:acetylornithine deacetylase